MKAVFMDLFGTLGEANPFRLYHGVPRALKKLNEANMKVFLFSNHEQFIPSFGEITGQLENYNARLDDFYHCSHLPNEDCHCHKPKPGLLHQAAKDYRLDLKKCFVIGDTGNADMLAAHAVRAKKILVLTGNGKRSIRHFRYTWGEVKPDFVARDLNEAVNWILLQR
ncbi:D-glycero-D-manno-heptose 1,7-bisphosphate phosphatase [Scopulibacillus darangshiensis]|uniref:D,D-heptose 1,7-bisphosphate phosphatase n=1 Tax=Scopulibacillus darangshiensis TaxID=442528 RepID=A0A4R2P977_9BACL|nr:HAD-IIIA family hydrolase [Scopulibacillus darangshiensis]TCP31569.1 D-glycero-D-manno-heptose 1,7-bisphosphate phosphatase [Scopulibacillus darangshiensis]